MAPGSPEHGKEVSTSVEKGQLTVLQPQKLEGIIELLGNIQDAGETTGEDRSGDLPGGGARGAQGASTVSWRDQAIENLPPREAMEQEIKKHIVEEVAHLRKEIKGVERAAAKPGAAYKLNKLYARIRRLNGLLSELFETSVDVIRRIFIRVVIDKQNIIQ